MPPRYRWLLLAISFAVGIALMTVLWIQGRPLRNCIAPEGVLTYEFAWTRDRAEQILRSWGGLRPTAERQLLIDFGFLIAYPIFFSVSCALLSEHSPTLSDVGIVLSWVVLAATPLDATENITLLWMLHHGASTGVAQVAGWCAGIKFVLVYASMGYLLLQGAATLLARFG
jgi:hypothetical protein